jgi:hypothetical protein
MYNILNEIMGAEWTDMAERYSIHDGISLVLYCNSDDTDFVDRHHASTLINHIREKAKKEGFKAGRTSLISGSPQYAAREP